MQGKNLQISYANARRMLVESPLLSDDFNRVREQKNRLLIVSSITFDAEMKISAFPPVIYYSSSENEFFKSAKSIIYYLALSLLILSLMAVSKKMHLHSFTFTVIVAKVWLTFGLTLEDKLDWVNTVLQDIKPFAMIGGISLGKCCTNQSSFYEHSSEFLSNSLYILILWIISWIFCGILYTINKFCTTIYRPVEYLNYFTMTIHLLLIFPMFYSSLNVLYNYSIDNPVDVFNTFLAIAISILCLFILCLSWILSSNTNFKLLIYPEKK